MRATVLSCSGGKDSTAAGLHLIEQGITFEAIFCDTGWEAPETYAYLREVLPGVLGPIRWLRAEVKWPERLKLHSLRASGAPAAEIEAAERAEGARTAALCEEWAREMEGMLGVEYSAFVRVALHKGIFPRRTGRWCTQELKAWPAKAYLATLDNPVNVVGIRHEESAARAAMPEWEEDKYMDCDVWRPLIRWTLDDVIAIHARHGLTPNPLYLGTAVRVGCYPCIFSRKEEIRFIPPERVAVIRVLEERVKQASEMRLARRGEEPEKMPATFFQAEEALSDGSYHWPIDTVMEWARTTRGGRQVELFASKARDAGCMRWGLCDLGGAR